MLRPERPRRKDATSCSDGKSFSTDEVESAKSDVTQQLAAYRDLAEAVAATTDPTAAAALEAFEVRLTTGLVLALDRRFVHRVRMITGKDGTRSTSSRCSRTR